MILVSDPAILEYLVDERQEAAFFTQSTLLSHRYRYERELNLIFCLQIRTNVYSCLG